MIGLPFRQNQKLTFDKVTNKALQHRMKTQSETQLGSRAIDPNWYTVTKLTTILIIRKLQDFQRKYVYGPIFRCPA